MAASILMTKRLVSGVKTSTCFYLQWLWPLLGCQPVGGQTTEIVNQSPNNTHGMSKRQELKKHTCIQSRTGPKISSCSTQTLLSRIWQDLWFNSSSTENHKLPKSIHSESIRELKAEI